VKAFFCRFFSLGKEKKRRKKRNPLGKDISRSRRAIHKSPLRGKAFFSVHSLIPNKFLFFGTFFSLSKEKKVQRKATKKVYFSPCVDGTRGD
jgi:hypothetical protein